MYVMASSYSVRVKSVLTLILAGGRYTSLKMGIPCCMIPLIHCYFIRKPSLSNLRMPLLLTSSGDLESITIRLLIQVFLCLCYPPALLY